MHSQTTRTKEKTSLEIDSLRGIGLMLAFIAVQLVVTPLHAQAQPACATIVSAELPPVSV